MVKAQALRMIEDLKRDRFRCTERYIRAIYRTKVSDSY